MDSLISLRNSYSFVVISIVLAIITTSIFNFVAKQDKKTSLNNYIIAAFTAASVAWTSVYLGQLSLMEKVMAGPVPF